MACPWGRDENSGSLDPELTLLTIPPFYLQPGQVVDENKYFHKC